MVADWDIKWWFEKAKLINEFARQNRVYCANVIEELHANENAHSRLLRMFLQYDNGYKEFPIFKKFLLMPKIRSAMSSVEMKNPEFFNEKDRIDLLVKDSQYALIIENKICGAKDQDGQLERYIQCMIEKGISEKNIYVVYLTLSGEKIVSEESLTDTAKQILEFNDETKDSGRFIPLNYRYDILPWLEEQVLPNCCIKEDLLISGLKQYIDYLKNLIGIETDYNQNRKIMCEIQKELEIKTLSDWYDRSDHVNKFAEKLKNCIGIEIRKIIDKKIEEYNDKIQELNGKGFTLDYECSYGGFWIDIKHKSWENYRFRCSNENETEIGIGLLKEKKSTKENTHLKDDTVTRFKNDGYENYPVWSIWKKFKTGLKLYSARYWEDYINIGDILDEFEKIRAILEENDKYLPTI